MGKLHVCKSTVVDEKSGNSALFFQCLSFQSYHVIHQQEFNTLKHLREHTVKNTAKLRRTMIFFYAVSLKYKTQAHSHRNQMFLGLKYMLAYMINLRKTFSPAKYDLKIINMRSYQNYFSLTGDLSLFHWKLFDSEPEVLGIKESFKYMHQLMFFLCLNYSVVK